MTLERLEWHLENWSVWMKGDSLRLGYPSRSMIFATGGSSGNEEFDIMCEQADKAKAREMNGLIDSLQKPYITAINHVWLKTPFCWPTQDMDYEVALERLIELAKRRKID